MSSWLCMETVCSLPKKHLNPDEEEYVPSAVRWTFQFQCGLFPIRKQTTATGALPCSPNTEFWFCCLQNYFSMCMRCMLFQIHLCCEKTGWYHFPIRTLFFLPITELLALLCERQNINWDYWDCSCENAWPNPQNSKTSQHLETLLPLSSLYRWSKLSYFFSPSPITEEMQYCLWQKNSFKVVLFVSVNTCSS